MARTSAAVALATLPERVSVLEIKVETIEEKIDDLKGDVKDMHDCLDRTRDGILEQLSAMNKSSCEQHNTLALKIESLEKVKSKYTMYIMILLAFGAGTGWAGHLNLPMIIKFLGI